MKMTTLLLTVALLVPSCLAVPAKLDQLVLGSSLSRDRSLLANGLGAAKYNYEAPSIPSGLYELPGSPPAPIIPPRPPPTTTTTTTTTTPPPPPPPPSGLYGAPDIGADPSNLNPNFVSVPIVLDVPEVPKATRAPVTVSTPSGFSPPMMDKGQMPYMPYDISWGIDDREEGNVFSHSERSEGNDVQGEYRVLLPDGRMQVVSFWADPESGYNAKVNYE